MAETVAFQRVQRPPRFILLAGLGLAALGLLIAIVWLLPSWLDWSQYRGTIARSP